MKGATDPARPKLLPQSLGDPEPLTPGRLAWLHREGLPPSVIAGRFQVARERVAGLIDYYGLASGAELPRAQSGR